MLSLNPQCAVFPHRCPRMTLATTSEFQFKSYHRTLCLRESLSFASPRSGVKASRLRFRLNSEERSNLVDETANEEEKKRFDAGRSGIGGGGENWNDWISSGLLFVLFAGLMYYVYQLAPNQTPYRDMYFLQKLFNLKGSDGFHINEVLVSLWYIMGLWPLVYSMLLIPTGRSSTNKIPVWPFLSLSIVAGAYALVPYFIIWKPPPPAIKEDEISSWPLKFLESRITAGITLVAGLGLLTYSTLAGWDAWKEFYQYFRESKFIHVTCIDFALFSTFAPFWVYNDMTARKWFPTGYWPLYIAIIPFVGPLVYLLLRPPLSALPMSFTSQSDEP